MVLTERFGKRYAIISDHQGKVISDTGSVAVGDKVDARLANGRLGLIVNKID